MKKNEELFKKTKMHPCYDEEAHHKYARIHLPVAPRCNIQCGYCNRKFDCVNESRPGVTSAVLDPEKALDRYIIAKEKVKNLSVVGIAGPGDALANLETVKDTLSAVRFVDPKVIFCLSTNGLMLNEYDDEMIDLEIKHVTVTVNAVDAEIGSKIYKHIIYQGEKIEGVNGAKILIEKQLQGIKTLVEKGVLVKVNTVMIKGINDSHIPEIYEKVKKFGVYIGNIMPLIPTKGTDFEGFDLIAHDEIHRMRKKCELDVKQMKHCKQCRADAVGKLGQDCSLEYKISS